MFGYGKLVLKNLRIGYIYREVLKNYLIALVSLRANEVCAAI